jgi:hypothetical protein
MFIVQIRWSPAPKINNGRYSAIGQRVMLKDEGDQSFTTVGLSRESTTETFEVGNTICPTIRMSVKTSGVFLLHHR